MTEQTENTSAAQIAALEKFVVDNDELAELEARVGRFNVFDALGVVRQEIRHSNFLAWLLHPAESHGQGQLFLRAVLMDLLRESPREWRPMSPVELEGAPLRGVQVLRESEHLDLLIVAEQPAVVFAIENKIDSNEHSDQLARYKAVVARRFPNHKPMFVYLTPEGDDSSDEEWVAYDYGRLHDALTRCLRVNEGSIGGDVRAFLDHYLNVLRGHLMDDPEIDRLCDTIYRNHRQALDLIFERKSDPRRELCREFAKSMEAIGGYEIRQFPSACLCIPKEWLSLLPPISSKNETSGWIQPQFGGGAELKRVFVEIWIGPTTDEPARTGLIETIRAKGEPFGLKVSAKNAPMWTKIYGKIVIADQSRLEVTPTTLEKVRSGARDFHILIQSITPLLREAFG